MVVQPHILIVGFGSAGRRHAQNLARRGATISAVDTRAERLSAPVELAGAFTSLDAALAGGCFAGVVVATPTAFHLDQTEKALAAGCRVMLEKPVSLDLASASRMAAAEAKARLPILLGYTWRWWPALRELRARVHSGVIGKPLRAEFVMASHLEDWHPGEPLRDFFMSSAKLGGGALLDESHWIDQMLWIFGMPAGISAEIGRISALPIDSDDHVELSAVYDDGLRVRVHLDLYTRPTDRSIAIFGDRGALTWNFECNVIRQFDVAAQRWQDIVFKGERNDMFDALAAEFLAAISGARQPSCTLDDGLAVMRIIDAARESQIAEGRRITLGL